LHFRQTRQTFKLSFIPMPGTCKHSTQCSDYFSDKRIAAQSPPHTQEDQMDQTMADAQDYQKIAAELESQIKKSAPLPSEAWAAAPAASFANNGNDHNTGSENGEAKDFGPPGSTWQNNKRFQEEYDRTMSQLQHEKWSMSR
jgi:hypothetical protein